jgi:thiol-disulfide isomerase/thioredoxin
MVPIQITALLLAATGVGETVLYDFQASWCGPCKMMTPVVQQLSAEGYPVRKIDVDQNAALAQKFGVTNIPCFVLVVDGKERGRIIGATNYQRLSGLLSAAGVLPATASTVSTRGQSPERPRKLLPLAGTLFSKSSRKEEPAANLNVPRVALGQPVAISTTGPVATATVQTVEPPSRPRMPRPMTPRPQEHRSIQALADQLLRASVRLKVHDPQGHSLGSGTMIDSWMEPSGVYEALILTCAHIFRDSGGNGKIEVDLFDRAVPTTVVGTLVRYDLQNDIGLVSIRSDRQLPAIALIAEQQTTAVGESVLSIGCDHGSDPTVQQSTVKAINSFVGPPNIQVEGQPAVGRSGGGLFNERGELIGVCNFADPTDRAGLYGAAQLAHVMLRKIYPSSQKKSETPLAGAGKIPQNLAILAEASRTATASQELICIVRTGQGNESRHQVLVIDNASRALLEQITAEHSEKGRPFPTSLAVEAKKKTVAPRGSLGPGFPLR